MIVSYSVEESEICVLKGKTKFVNTRICTAQETIKVRDFPWGNLRQSSNPQTTFLSLLLTRFVATGYYGIFFAKHKRE